MLHISVWFGLQAAANQLLDSGANVLRGIVQHNLNAKLQLIAGARFHKFRYQIGEVVNLVGFKLDCRLEYRTRRRNCSGILRRPFQDQSARVAISSLQTPTRRRP